ncbi:SAM-dependent methyltransferase [Nakamurella flavida]|uniref:class I SAM-dependent methyltransferase n=1 Tax=Nakamurella flavida TaxID=363630 RepID=UPI0027800D49|nr:class I SAM-dependent methyltransferase [Nakamurella flavida]MDP9779657.1 SAM-dependent methyltransferase [Nakamurella flavida]
MVQSPQVDQGHGQASGWTAADTQDVLCALCGIPGRALYRLDPFGVVRCPTCRLVFVSPRLTPEALQRLYDEPAYFEGGVYGDQGRLSPAMLLQRTWTAGRLALIAAQRPAPARLLEIGSAYGLFLDAARAKGYEVSGVELSRTGAEHSRARFGLDVFCGQLEDAPTDEADVVCFWDTLEHVPDPLEFLRQVRSRLADDGVFALSVPYFSSLPARLLRTRWWTLKPEQHIWHYTPQTLSVLAARAGLVVTEVITSPVRPANVTRLDSLVAIGRALPAGD